MVNAYYNTRKTGPDEVTVTVVDFKPEKPEPEVEPLRVGLVARDACGDGTDEFLHIEPLVTWQVFPVPVFLESSIPSSLRNAVIRSFDAFNAEAGFKLYELTDNLAVAKVRVSIGPIDVAGNTIARAQWSYRTSTKEITRATITFDSNESWGDLSLESCGRTGNIFDCANVGTHEFGHISGLSHAPTDQLQTMYASTSPGKTLGRTLGNGDKKGFKLAYKVVAPPPPPPPEPENKPPIVKSFGVETEQDKSVLIILQGMDPDNDLITYTIIDKPTNGNLGITQSLNVWDYKPNQGFSGIDSFTYVAKDNKGAISNKGTVTINIKAISPPPPPPPEPHEHKLTIKQQVELKVAQLQYENAVKAGDENGIKIAKENLDNVRVKILVELHS